ncbi:MAG: hypothetical protein NTX45_23810 [Proteobacteria bacterium]|nr:hypothetical protein [Pseudomonadota bacterium]
MTEQYHEVLIFEEVKTTMMFCPPFPENDSRIIKLKDDEIDELHKSFVFSTACWREYIGTWEIKDGRFYLNKIEGRYKILDNIPIFAEWFTGTLRIPKGEMLHHVHMGFGSIFEGEVYVKIEKGIFTESKTIDNRNKEVSYKDVGLFSDQRKNYPDSYNEFDDVFDNVCHMDLQRAKEILSSLALGRNPQTEMPLPRDSLFNHPDIIRSFWVVLSAFDNLLSLPKFEESHKSRIGRSWSEKEDMFLQREFKSGESIKDLARRHSCSERVISSRLQELGYFESPEFLTSCYLRNEEVLLRGEQSYLEQTTWGDEHADSNQESEPEWNSEEDDVLNSLSIPCTETQERDPETESCLSTDWGEIADDLDTSDWEKIMGGPDDDDIDRHNQNIINYEDDNDGLL